MSKHATLADEVYRLTFHKHTPLKQAMRENIQRARKFVLDESMNARL